MNLLLPPAVLPPFLLQHMVLPSRVLHLPMAFDERWTHEALAKYAKSVRPEAPYLPSNIQYIANNNGLKDKEDVSGTAHPLAAMHNAGNSSWQMAAL